MTQQRSSRWVFTENESPISFHLNLETLFDRVDNIKYICGQVEKAPTTDRLHFQGYVQLKTGQRLSWVKNNISSTAHFEKQRGTNQQARDYCNKNHTAIETSQFVEFGLFTKGAGQRTDLIQFKDKLKTGTRLRTVIDEDTGLYAKYSRFAEKVISLFPPQRTEESHRFFRVVLCVGEPGTGKTKWARTHDDLFIVPLSNGNQWYDGYDKHKNVLLDDFAGALSKLPLTSTLQLLDRYPISVPIKGGFTWWMPDRIIITTNLHPRAWYDYKDREVHYDALCRRITHVLSFHDPDEEPLEEDAQEYLTDRENWPVVITNDPPTGYVG